MFFGEDYSATVQEPKPQSWLMTHEQGGRRADDEQECHWSLFDHIADIIEGAGYIQNAGHNQGVGMNFAAVPCM